MRENLKESTVGYSLKDSTEGLVRLLMYGDYYRATTKGMKKAERGQMLEAEVDKYPYQRRSKLKVSKILI